MRLVLAGQPNSGKSTIFNSVAGYRSATANFPKSSVSYVSSHAMILGREVEVVDLPGIYSLTSSRPHPGKAEHYLLHEDFDLIVDVVDASRLGRSLELTIQLLELGRPVVVALNFNDEALRRGIRVDHEALSQELGVPVVRTVARRGRGLRELFRVAVQTYYHVDKATSLPLDLEVEGAIDRVRGALSNPSPVPGITSRFTALKLLEEDPYIGRVVFERHPELKSVVGDVAHGLAEAHGWSAAEVVSGSRHAVAHNIEERSVTLQRPRIGWREVVDRLLLHPLWGGPLMVVILGGLFWMVFGVGQRVEVPLIAAFEQLQTALATKLPPDTLVGTMANGVVMGLAGGVAIVLPYLLPFLIGLALLEDTGYLPRMAYILDNLMHRLGLHGKSVLPLILGYGCSVPAIMATRILESPKDRRITTILASFIPCSARTIVIFGLVAAYLGPLWALGIYLLNLAFVVVLGNLMARRMRGASPGLVLEIPDLSPPHTKILVAKTWLALKEFITIAWPLLIASSVVLGLLEWANAADTINAMLAPLTVWVLGLPAVVGMTLVFGIMRKELTLVMLVQALGTTQVGSVLTTSQLVTFTLFVVFYVPCVATVAVIARELGWKDAGWIAGFTVIVAVLISLASRLFFAILT